MSFLAVRTGRLWQKTGKGADRVAVELMGIDYAKVGYLNYCAEAGLGEGNLRKIEIVGEPIARHVRRYRLADNIDKQLDWMTPPKPI